MCGKNVQFGFSVSFSMKYIFCAIDLLDITSVSETEQSNNRDDKAIIHGSS